MKRPEPRFLPRSFPPSSPIARYHVAAKRYLSATKPECFNRLSVASAHRLGLRSGPMTAAEVAQFARNPNLDQIIQVRYLDVAGKHPTMQTPPFAPFAPMARRVVDAHCKVAT